MSVDPNISLQIVYKELEDCQKPIELYGWKISEIDSQKQIFTVRIISPVDQEEYIIEITFDNYKEWPLLIEFIDPITGERGTKHAYPAPNSRHGAFFHGKQCICHPCSRKAYKGFANVHNDWSIVGWQQNPKVGTLTNLKAILSAIYCRINNKDIYKGRMG